MHKSLLLFLVTVILGFVNALLFFTYRLSERPDIEAHSWIGQDFPERVPSLEELESVQMTVEDTAHYPLGDNGAWSWHSTDSRSRGYCRLGPRHRLFAVAMFHELHCLRIFNAAFGTAGNLAHVAHCLSYLRHGALCAADVTLERGDFIASGRNATSVTHVCRDWSRVYTFMENNWERWTSVRTDD